MSKFLIAFLLIVATAQAQPAVPVVEEDPRVWDCLVETDPGWIVECQTRSVMASFEVPAAWAEKVAARTHHAISDPAGLRSGMSVNGPDGKPQIRWDGSALVWPSPEVEASEAKAADAFTADRTLGLLRRRAAWADAVRIVRRGQLEATLKANAEEANRIAGLEMSDAQRSVRLSILEASSLKCAREITDIDASMGQP